MDLSATAYVILGMVSREPRSGYEIKAAVDGTTRFFWAASYGQIYPELKRLSEAGLIEGVDASQGDRKRTRYAITADGTAELKDWLRRPPETAEMREEGLLKLFFSGVLKPAEAVETLRTMRQRRLELARRLRSLEPERAEAAPEDSYPLMVLRGGVEFNEWFADWCERMEAQLLEPAIEEGSS
ncbi:MAG TPA: PadR family transcriptional regulator [Solirubrobacterales bacterium]|nr:PadR family transcriptional regulator [Solirubrobacterales bacterium]